MAVALLFRKGAWIEVHMPPYVDPSWHFGDRQRAASIVSEAMEAGLTFEAAWIKAEEAISGVSRKQHSPPQNKKEDESVEEEA
jgi:hypothetical protein